MQREKRPGRQMQGERTCSSFSKYREFYKTLFGLLGFVVLQNVIAYTVNMADNVMLGMYRQEALSGAATVNQIFFLIQQFGVSVGNTLVAISAQDWGERRMKPVKTLTGYALKLSGAVGAALIVVGMCIPRRLCGIFTSDQEIIGQGAAYMRIVIWSFAIYCITATLYAALRAVGIVKISFYTAILSLVVNCGINYLLIFGRCGLPEMGIRGAAVGTLVSRVLELIVVLGYCRHDRVLDLFGDLNAVFAPVKELRKDFYKIYVPNFLSTVLWAISIPVQTAILGNLSADALAANSVSSTFYQYAKVIIMAMSSVSGVMIGKAIGEGDRELVKQTGRTVSVLDVCFGLVLGVLLFVLRKPLLSLYKLNTTAMALADKLIMLQALIMVGMAYEMPVSLGVIQGGGDADYIMRLNMISTWAIVMPLTFMGAYRWHVPIVWLVLIIQSDQLFKCLPVFTRFRSYKWIRKLTRSVDGVNGVNGDGSK